MRLATLIAAIGAPACLAISYTGQDGMLFALFLMTCALMVLFVLIDLGRMKNGRRGPQRPQRRQPGPTAPAELASLPAGYTAIQTQAGESSSTQRHILPSGAIVEIATTTTNGGTVQTVIHDAPAPTPAAAYQVTNPISNQREIEATR